jgi:hypothetical protein
MTRCECAELSFDELARRARKGSPENVLATETGCGHLCTACLPDLCAHLDARR